MEEHKPQKFMFFHGLAGGGGGVEKIFADMACYRFGML